MSKSEVLNLDKTERIIFEIEYFGYVIRGRRYGLLPLLFKEKESTKREESGSTRR